MMDQGYTIPTRSMKHMEEMDIMKPEMRALVHDFGSELVSEFVNSNIKNPTVIRRLILASWLGARSPINRAKANNGVRTAISAVDWYLIQNGAQITARNLVNILWSGNMIICPQSPTIAMIEASMDVDLGRTIVSKKDKHHRRLTAALNAASREWREAMA